MKNLLKILLIFIILLISSMLKIDEKAYSYNNLPVLTNQKSTISSSFSNDIPFVLSQNNTKQEISQLQNKRSTPNNITDKFNYTENIFVYDCKYLTTSLTKYSHNIHIASDLESSIHTRAP